MRKIFEKKPHSTKPGWRETSARPLIALAIALIAAPLRDADAQSGKSPETPKQEASAPSAEPVLIKISDKQIAAAGIELRPLEPERESDELIVPGIIAAPPQQLRIVATPAAGLIEAFLVAPDEDVQEGQPLAQLRSPDIVERQRAYLAALSDEALAAEKLRRDEELYRERIIAERRLIVTRAEAISARSALDERLQLLLLHGVSESDIEKLRRDRKIQSSLTIRAPMSGVVLQRHGAPGERVADSAPLVALAKLDPIWVNLQIPLARAPMLSRVSKAVIPSLGLEGKIVRIGRTVDPTTQSVTAIAEFATRGVLARPGQAVQAALRIASGGGRQWRAPAASVIHHNGRNWIFVRTPDGFKAAPVEKIAETSDYASVRADLPPGQQVVTRGVMVLLGEMTDEGK